MKLEDRVAQLEKEVAELKGQVSARQGVDECSLNNPIGLFLYAMNEVNRSNRYHVSLVQQ